MNGFLITSIDDLLRDTDSEEEEAGEKDVTKRKMNVKKGSAWLKEGGNEDIVDFLDPSVAKKVFGRSFYNTYCFVELWWKSLIFVNVCC